MISVLLFVGFCCFLSIDGGTVGESNIAKQFLPFKAVSDVFTKHVQEDEGFQAALIYFRGDEWNQMVNNLKQTPTWQAYIKYLAENNLLNLECIFSGIQNITDLVDISKFSDKDPSLTSIFQDLKATIIALIMHSSSKGENDLSQMIDLYQHLTAPMGKEHLQNVLKLPETISILDKLKSLGLHLDDFFSFFFKF